MCVCVINSIRNRQRGVQLSASSAIPLRLSLAPVTVGGFRGIGVRFPTVGGFRGKGVRFPTVGGFVGAGVRFCTSVTRCCQQYPNSSSTNLERFKILVFYTHACFTALG